METCRWQVRQGTPTRTYGSRPTLTLHIYCPPQDAPVVPYVPCKRTNYSGVPPLKLDPWEIERFLDMSPSELRFWEKKIFFLKKSKNSIFLKLAFPQSCFYRTVFVTLLKLVKLPNSEPNRCFEPFYCSRGKVNLQISRL